MHFQVVPFWAEDKEDAWAEVVKTRWLREDEEFAAMARRNAENRGNDGTHYAGNRSYTRFKGKMVCIYIDAFIFRHVPT